MFIQPLFFFKSLCMIELDSCGSKIALCQLLLNFLYTIWWFNNGWWLISEFRQRILKGYPNVSWPKKLFIRSKYLCIFTCYKFPMDQALHNDARRFGSSWNIEPECIFGQSGTRGWVGIGMDGRNWWKSQIFLNWVWAYSF